ncbi:hypothetical protein [Mycobacterium servetii]|uniref:DUF3828 domain-containing protein n=1 Tax=Mycobacterium servetii TaxID=3237418 RepID=A0ABV4CCI0_9MYCO
MMRRIPLLWWRIRGQVRRVPARARWVLVIGVIALGGLAWQHHDHAGAGHDASSSSSTPSSAAPSGAAPPGGGDQGGDPGAFANEPGLGPTPVVDSSVESARATAQRFATNFASPGASAQDWYARLAPDLSAQLQEQYRLTDLRNVPQATVQAVTGPLNQMPGTMAFDITYSDSTRVEVRVEMGTEGWKVINVLPLDSAGGSAAGDPALGGTAGSTIPGVGAQ